MIFGCSVNEAIVGVFKKGQRSKVKGIENEKLS